MGFWWVEDSGITGDTMEDRILIAENLTLVNWYILHEISMVIYNRHMEILPATNGELTRQQLWFNTESWQINLDKLLSMVDLSWWNCGLGKHVPKVDNLHPKLDCLVGKMWTLLGPNDPLAQHSWAATSNMVDWRKQPSRWRKRAVHRCSPRLWMGTPRLGEIHHLCYEIAITSFSSSAICLGQNFRRWNITGTGSMFIKPLVLMVQVTHPHSFHSKF